MRAAAAVAVLSLALSLTGCKAHTDASGLRDEEVSITNAPAPVTASAPRTEAQSQWYGVPENSVDFFMSYSGFKPKNGSITEGERFQRLQIGQKALAMAAQAKKVIVASAFLFDSMYSIAPEGAEAQHSDEQVAAERHITELFRDLMLKKRQENPDMLIVLVLDPINRAYVDRRSPAEKMFREAGIDIFYSDLASTPAVGEYNLAMSKYQDLHRNDVHAEDLSDWAFLTMESAFSAAGALSPLIGNSSTSLLTQISALRAGKPLTIAGQKLVIDGEPVGLEMIFNASLLKANHRKLFVVDNGDDYEALVSSANPHDASFGAANTALSVIGAPARYVYNVIRGDILFSAQRAKIVAGKYSSDPEKAERFARRFADWSDVRADEASRQTFLEKKLVALDETGAAEGPVKARFVTESKIADAIIEELNAVQPDDNVRIQMFYLSYQKVLDAIVAAAKRVKTPMRLILDPNKDAFNKTKDGTPNRQVARWLLAAKKKDPKVNFELRWYSTHGEQNHAKIMSVTNSEASRWTILTGSANWTGKNIGGANMESDLVVKGSQKANEKFNAQFDTFWSNSEDGVEYTIAYDDPRYKYSSNTAAEYKWTLGEKSGLVAW